MEWEYIKKTLTALSIVVVVYFTIVYIIQRSLFAYTKEPEITAEMIAGHVVNELTYELITKGSENYTSTNKILTPDELAIATNAKGIGCDANSVSKILTTRMTRSMQKKR